MKSKHEHKPDCAHAKLKLCNTCDVVECQGCGKEWGEKQIVLNHCHHQRCVHCASCGRCYEGWHVCPNTVDTWITITNTPNTSWVYLNATSGSSQQI